MSSFIRKRLNDRGAWITRFINNEPCAMVLCCVLSLVLAVMVLFPHQTRDFLLGLLT